MRGFDYGKKGSGIFLLFCIASYLVVGLFSYANSYSPGGIDGANHLFQTWFIAGEGMAAWNHYWYAGTPLLDQYPPLTHVFSAALSLFFGVVDGYKIASLLGFLCLPLTFWIFLRALGFGEKEKGFALLFFSFSIVYLHYFEQGVYSALSSFNVVMLYFASLKKTIESSGARNVALSAALLSVCFLSHALNPAYAAIFSIPMVLAYSWRRMKEYAAVVFLTGLLSAFFWIPYFYNYTAPSTGALDVGLQWLLGDLGRSFVYSVNYVSLFFMAVFIPVLAYVFLRNLKGRRDSQYTVFLALFFLSVLALRLANVSAAAETRRMLFFVPFFLAPYLAKGLSGFRYEKAVSVLLIAPLILLFFSYPPVQVDVNSDVLGLADYVGSSGAERVLLVPESYDVMTENRTYAPAYETVYSTFLIPYATGKEVLNGWWPTGYVSIDKDSEYNGLYEFSCERTKEYGELLSDASLLNRNTLTERTTCAAALDPERYCLLAGRASLDLLLVNRLFPEVESYVSSLPCARKTWENAGFSAYEIDSLPYAVLDPPADYTYSKTPGGITIGFDSESSGTVRLRLAESFSKHWKAYFDGLPTEVADDGYGFLLLEKEASAGAHTVELEYRPERFGNVFLYISVLSWTCVLGYLAATRKRR